MSRKKNENCAILIRDGKVVSFGRMPKHVIAFYSQFKQLKSK